MALQRLPMAQYLIQKGYLTQDKLDEAVKVQNQSNSKDLGRVLLELNLVGEREVLEAKAQERGLPFIDLDRVKPEPTAINVVPERIVKMHSAIPVRKDNMQLWVAMSNPDNIQAVDDIALASGCRVRPALAVPGAIDDAISRLYGGESAASNGNGAPAAAATTTESSAKPNPMAKPGQAGGGKNDLRGLIAQAQVGRDLDASQVRKSADDTGEDLADQAPIIKLANAIIQQAILDRASDIHVEPQERSVRVRYRVDGVLLEAMTVPKNLVAPLISRLKIMAEMNIAERRVPQDGRIEVRHQGNDFDLRVSSIPTPFGEKIVMRILDKNNAMVGLNKLGFLAENEAQIEEIITQPNGMFLCTGPTGSGKTTTQYSVLNRLNSVEKNIITVEDPVEYQLAGISQVQVNRKAGLTFATALRAFLRQDPDIIMVGEMRDLETAEIAIEASLTGHLVLSTLHTNDAPSATIRMIDMGVEPYLIAATVVGILAQRLGRRIDQDHKEPYEVPAIDLRRFGFEFEDPDQMITLYRGIPHDNNRQTGYRGRMGIHELMVMNEEIAELVVRRAPTNEIKNAAKANGMKELREDGLAKVLNGMTDPQEVMRVVFTAGY